VFSKRVLRNLRSFITSNSIVAEQLQRNTLAQISLEFQREIAKNKLRQDVGGTIILKEVLLSFDTIRTA
jgi:hypothetical protein